MLGGDQDHWLGMDGWVTLGGGAQAGIGHRAGEGGTQSNGAARGEKRLPGASIRLAPTGLSRQLAAGGSLQSRQEVSVAAPADAKAGRAPNGIARPQSVNPAGHPFRYDHPSVDKPSLVGTAGLLDRLKRSVLPDSWRIS